MLQHFNPATRMKNSLGNFLHTLESLPRLVAHAEETIDVLRNGGLKLNSDSLGGMAARRRGILPAWLPWLLVLVLVGILLWRR
jgi:hypothetical protein